jgi:transcriptional regulator with XRE-family HTH domain
MPPSRPTVPVPQDPTLELASTRRSIGRRLAALREGRQLSVRGLGDAAGVTGGFISQVENGHVMPSVGSLLRIALALGVEVGDFFERPSAHGEVQRPGERTLYRYDEHGVLDEVISDDPTREVLVLHTVIEPDGGTGDKVFVHGTRVEVVYVLSGELELGLGKRRLTLKAGDSVTFSGEVPHGVWNRSSEPAEAMWVAAPARY